MDFFIPSKRFNATMCKFSCLSSFASKLIIVKNKNLKERLVMVTIILLYKKSFIKYFFLRRMEAEGG